MNPALANLGIFVLVVLGATLVFYPRGGLVGLFRRRRRNAERVLMEDALKHLFEQTVRGHASTLTALGDSIGVSGTRAFDLVGRMQRARLVETREGRIVLSDGGRRYALQIIRAHRLWERYLAEETGISPERWHAEAERREHSITPDQLDELSRRMGDPRYDPHGDPIPTADGELPDQDVLALPEIPSGTAAEVVHIEDEPDAVFERVLGLGIHVGTQLRVRAESGDRVVVESAGRTIVIPSLVAANVSVRRIEVGEVAVADGTWRPLSKLREGESCEVARIEPDCRGVERRRLMDLGIVPGTLVEFERRGPTGGLTAYRVRGTVIALREDQARWISVRSGREEIA